MTVLADQPKLSVPSTARVLLEAVRPKQWVKNVLVFAAPAAAGALLRPATAERAGVALAAVTAIACGLYLVNDVKDADLDRLHDRKSRRPVATGALSKRTAWWAALGFTSAGLGLAASGRTALLIVLACYLVLTVLYAFGLKHVAWLEMAIVASGFVLRTLAGATATGVDASEWLLTVVSAAAVVVVAGKRTSELLEGAATCRPVLRAYSFDRLRLLRRVAATGLIMAYFGWALFRPDLAATVFALCSLVPVIGVVGRWEWRTERARTGAPEDVLLSDRWIGVGVALWLAAFIATVLASGLP